MRNHTVTTFILLVMILTDDPQLKIVIFIFLFFTYMLSVTGNLPIISLTFIDSHLKTAIYFFLQNFSFLEISFTSACIPRYLYNISTGDKTIAYNKCISQIFFADLFGVTEFFLLATYDRYVAICKPLHYMTIINNMVCRRLTLCCWMVGLLIIILPLSLGLYLEFCDSNVIDHFFCDAVPLLKISCSETWLIEQMIIVCAMLTFIMTLVCVVLSIIHHQDHFTIPFCPAKEKGIFHMFSSHLIVVSVTYGSCIFIDVKPSAKESAGIINKDVTMLTTSIAPMLNLFIYTLRNKQVKQAFGDAIKRIALFSKI